MLRKVRKNYRRFVSFLLAFVMTFTNVGSNLSIAFAGGEDQEVLYQLSGEDLQAAIQDAVAGGEVCDPEEFAFGGTLKKDYEELFDGNVYQLDVDAECEMEVDGASMEVYYDADKEQVVFLFVNESDMIVDFSVDVDGYMVENVVVKPNASQLDPEDEKEEKAIGDANAQAPENHTSSDPNAAQGPSAEAGPGVEAPADGEDADIVIENPEPEENGADTDTNVEVTPDADGSEIVDGAEDPSANDGAADAGDTAGEDVADANDTEADNAAGAEDEAADTNDTASDDVADVEDAAADDVADVEDAADEVADTVDMADDAGSSDEAESADEGQAVAVISLHEVAKVAVGGFNIPVPDGEDAVETKIIRGEEPAPETEEDDVVVEPTEQETEEPAPEEKTPETTAPEEQAPEDPTPDEQKPEEPEVKPVDPSVVPDIVIDPGMMVDPAVDAPSDNENPAAPEVPAEGTQPAEPEVEIQPEKTPAPEENAAPAPEESADPETSGTVTVPVETEETETTKGADVYGLVSVRNDTANARAAVVKVAELPIDIIEEVVAETYALHITHLLHTDNLGDFQDVQDIELTTEDFAEGAYDVLQNAIDREGMEVTTGELSLTEDSFAEDGIADVTIEYGVAEGYRAVLKNGGNDSGIMPVAIYRGKIEDVEFVTEEQIKIEITYSYEDGTVARQKNVFIVEKSKESYTYSVEAIPGYTMELSSDMDEGVAEIDGQTIMVSLEGKDVVVNIVFVANKVGYTVVHHFPGVGGAQEETETDEKTGPVGEFTEAEPIEKEGFIAQTILQEVISADGSTSVDVYYDRLKYKVHYDSQGGSYVSPKTGEYEEVVKVYEEESCDIEAHTHTQIPSYNADRWNVGKVSGCYTSTQHGSGWNTSYSWDLSCGKVEHTHSPACTYAPAPTRNGYTFGGWYKDPACENPADKDLTLKSDVTVYAKWIPGTASYTVVYMKEVYDNSTNGTYYVYDSSEVLKGTVGTTVSAKEKSGGISYHFYNSDDSSRNVELEADGSTVVYAYYDLIEYTIIFDLQDEEGGRFSNSITGTITMNGHVYHGSEYRLQVVLGQDISAAWPTPDNTKRSNEQVLDTWNGNYKTKRFEVTTDMLDRANDSHEVTYNASWMNGGTEKTVEYWLQNADGNGYTKSENYSQTFYSNSTLSAKEIYGFTKHDGTPSGYKGNEVEGSGWQQSVVKYRFYYDRKSYSITYKYHEKELKIDDGIKFGANINTEKYTYTPTVPDGLPKDASFGGWYDNPELGGNTYRFGTMPDNNVVLYAKWVMPGREVTKVYGDGVTQEVKETVPYGNSLENLETPTWEGHVFEGWYKDPGYTQEFDPNAPITEDTTIYAKWTEDQTVKYTVHYVTKDKDGTESDIDSPREKTGLKGYTVQERAVSHEGYVVDANKKSLVLDDTGKDKNGDYKITFYYTPISDLKYKVDYRYSDGRWADGENVWKKTDATVFSIYPDKEIVEKWNKEGYKVKETFIRAELTKEETTFSFTLEPVQYTITYMDEIGEEGKWTNWNKSSVPGEGPNPTEYTVEDGPMFVTNPQKEGFIFTGWTLGEGMEDVTPEGKAHHNSEAVVIEPGTKGDLVFVATWEPENPSLTVEKTANKTTGAALGEEITYTITVTNNGNVTISDITVADPLTSLEKKVDKLAPGESAEIKTTYTVLEGDIVAGSIVNTATATGKDPNGGGVSESDDETVTTVEPAPALTVEKTADKTTGAALNDVITYTITVTNSGNVTVSDITVTDPLTELEQSVGTLAPGKDASVTTKHTITEADILAGSFVNTATATGTDPKGGEVSGTDDETVTTVAQAPALTVEKSADKTTGAELNDVITYTITVTNSGNVTVKDITVTDPLTDLNQNVGTLAPNASTSVTTTHTITETDILAGSFVNTATAKGTDPNGDEVANRDDEIVTTATPAPALTVEKKADKTNNAKLNDVITYTITVTNSGNVTVSNITVTDPLTGLNQNVGMLEPGKGTSVTTTHTITEEDILVGSFVNTATATGTDPNGKKVGGSGNATVTTEEQQHGLTTTKTLTNKGTGENGAFKADETATFDIVVENTGNITQKNVVVADTMPGAKIVAGDGYTVNEDGTASIPTIEAGKSVTVKAEYTVTQDDIDNQTKLANTATVEGKGSTPEPEPEPIPTEDKNPGLTTTKTLTNEGSGENGAFKANETATFDIVVENTGNTTQHDVVVTDTMAGAKIVKGEGYTLNEDGTATIGEIPVGESVTVKAEYTVTQADIDNQTELANTATVKGEGPAPDPDPEPIPTEDKNPGLTTTKTLTNSGSGENGAFKANETAKFDIVVENTGNTTQHDVVVTDTMAGAKIVKGEGYTLNEDGTATIGEIPVGESVTVKAEYTVTQDDIDNQTELANTATVEGEGPTPEPEPEPIPTEDKNPGLTTTKTLMNSGSGENGAFKANETATFDIVVENTGNTTQHDVVVTDTMAGAKIVAGDGYTVNEDGTATIPTIEAGKSVTVKAEYTVTQADIDNQTELANTATVKGEGPAPDPEPEPIPTEEKNPGLTTTKTLINGMNEDGSERKFKAGETATFNIVVENTGNTTQHDVVVTDTMAGAKIVAGEGYTVNEDGTATIPTVEAGKSVTVKAEYTVTQADIDNQTELANTATVEGEGPTPAPEPEPIPTEDKNPGLTSTKEVTNTGSGDNGTFKAGETATFDITVTNSGNTTQTNVIVTEQLDGATIVTGEGYTIVDGQAVIAEMAPGAEVVVKATYTVTQDDIDSVKVLKNVALVDGENEEGKDDPTPEVEIPVESWKITKVVTNLPARGYFQAGEVAEFNITVINNGEEAVNNIVVEDELAGAQVVEGVGYMINEDGHAVIDTLASGTSVSIHATYTVTRDDVSRGHFNNSATAFGTPDGEDIGERKEVETPDIPTGSYTGGGSSGGGGGGGSTGGTSSGTTTITDAAVPLATIDPGEVPLAALPQDLGPMTAIDDEGVPLAAILPKTGDTSRTRWFLIMAILSLFGLGALETGVRKEKRKEEE